MTSDKTDRFEMLGSGVSVAVNKTHRFGTDAFLLAHFAAPRRKDKVCDLGTGCGIIPLIFCRDSSAPQHIWGVDIQEDAVALFRESIEVSGLAQRITPLCADLRDLPTLAQQIETPLDVVTCNPPYKRAGSGIVSPDASDALARHETACTADDVCRAAKRLLRFGGRLCICQRPERLADFICTMRDHGLEPKRLRMVAKSAKDKPWLFLLEGILGGRSFLNILPPLHIGNGKVNHTDNQNNEELLEIYGYHGNEPKG